MAEKTGYRAHGRYFLIAPSKVRRVADNIRKKSYTEALALLEALPHKGAKLLKKVLVSAAANALYLNKTLDEEMLFVSELMVNEGPRMKRMWMRGRGRADMLQKKISHITVVVDQKKKAGA